MRRPALRMLRRFEWWLAAAFALAWMAGMSPLLRWGLPSHQIDVFLFGGGPVWRAPDFDIARDIAARREREAGADVDLNPITSRGTIIRLNTTHDQQAEIIRRYRLYSRQPDEMITFQALQRMDPQARDFDPRLYQYGGAYVYLVGAALGVAKVLGLVHVTGDAGYYLENPEAFGRFYVVARSISLAFGALALLGVYRLARMSGSRAAGWTAMLLTATMPVFISGALEAKPHLPSAALLVWSAVFAARYSARGRLADAAKLGLAAGLAFGFVLTGLAGLLHWPAVLITARPESQARTVRHLAIALALAALVYAVTNPYVLYNAAFHPERLASNVANSTAMYRDQVRRAGEGLVRIGVLGVQSAGPVVLCMGVAGLLAAARRAPRALGVISAGGVAMTALCALLAAGKPTEFARFLVLPSMLMAAAAGAVAMLLQPRHRPALPTVTVPAFLISGAVAYVQVFALDASGTRDTRYRAAAYLAQNLGPNDSVGVLQEPAPYAVPPIAFAEQPVLLLPETEPAELERAALPEWLVFTADRDRPTDGAWWRRHYREAESWGELGVFTDRITWAGKPVYVYRRLQALQ